jgi:hypothetical protein
MRLTEEHVTRAMARRLVSEGWEIVAVHPPDGQGPFVIPKPPKSKAIERSSYHPDIVAIRADGRSSARVILVECKLSESDIPTDYKKLSELSNSRGSLLFVLFRCQKFPGGPALGVDYEAVSRLPNESLPVEFAVAAMSDKTRSSRMGDLGGLKCSQYLFEESDLLRA